MKIAAVDSFLLSLPYRTSGAFHYIAGRPSNALSMLLVRVATEDGEVGWGEAFGHAGAVATKAMLDSLVGPLLVGADAADIPALMEQVRRKIHLFGLSGPALYAVSGIDIALWDLTGKRQGKSICDMLGGAKRDLPVYASFLRSSSEEALRRTCLQAAEEGYRTVKLHEIEVERMRLARAAVGSGVAIAVDTNCPWSFDQAASVLAQVRDIDLLWLEEPLWPPDDYFGLSRLRNAGSPISAGENASSIDDFRRLLDAKAVDVLQPSVSKAGGITEMLKIVTLARDRGVAVVPHCGYMGPGYLANLHLVASMPGNVPVERLYIELEETPFPATPLVAHGMTTVPAGPGLGCLPDMDVVEKYRIA